MTATFATCLACDWIQHGDQRETDRAAEKHGKATGHATSVRTWGETR